MSQTVISKPRRNVCLRHYRIHTSVCISPRPFDLWPWKHFQTLSHSHDEHLCSLKSIHIASHMCYNEQTNGRTDRRTESIMPPLPIGGGSICRVHILVPIWPWPWKPFHQCPLTWRLTETGFIKITSPSACRDIASREIGYVLTDGRTEQLKRYRSLPVSNRGPLYRRWWRQIEVNYLPKLSAIYNKQLHDLGDE